MRRELRTTTLLLIGAVALSGCGHHDRDQSAATPSATVVASTPATGGAGWTPVNLGTAAPNQVPMGRAGTPRGGVQHPAMSDPAAVARAVAITQATWDTQLDQSPQDAARRAAGWMTPALAHKTRTARTAGGGSWWEQLAAAKGWTTATATEWAPTSGKGTQRQVTLLVAIDAHGATLTDQHQLLVLTLTSTGDVKPTTAASASAKASAPAAKPSTPAGQWLVSEITYMPAN